MGRSGSVLDRAPRCRVRAPEQIDRRAGRAGSPATTAGVANVGPVFKRITWMGIGMAVGASGAFRAKRKVEATLDRYLPEQVADRAATSARNVGVAVRSAAAEGREVMKATEEELRQRVESRTYVGDRPSTERTAGASAEDPRTAPGPRRAGRPSKPSGAISGARRRSRR